MPRIIQYHIAEWLPFLNVKSATNKLKDIRTGKNTKYLMFEIMLSAYSCFHMQSQSFLSHQNLMERTKGRNNAEYLFGIMKIPTDNHIRTHLDEQTPEYLDDVYINSLRWLDKNKKLDDFKGINDNLLVALDGHDKQDCENAAGKRWLKPEAFTNSKRFIPNLPSYLTDSQFLQNYFRDGVVNVRYLEFRSNRDKCR